MKRALLSLLTCSCLVLSIYAQEELEQGLLLEKYQDGIIYYKDGRQYTALLNYDVQGRCFLFIDVNDHNNIKEFAEPHMISLIKIGNRTFLHDPGNIKEVLQIQPPILVEYKASIIDKGKNSGYGGRSATAAISSYSGIQASDGTYHRFDVKTTYKVNINKTYFIEVNKKKKRFSREKDFIKIYPKQRDILKKYIKDNKIDFNSSEQVIQLYNYAVTL